MNECGKVKEEIGMKKYAEICGFACVTDRPTDRQPTERLNRLCGIVKAQQNGE